MIDLNSVDWPETLQRCGIDARFLVNKQGPCPMHPEQGKTKFRFDNKGGHGTWICNDCGAGNGFTLLRAFTGLPDRDLLGMIEGAHTTCATSVERPASTRQWESDLSDAEKLKRQERLRRAWQRSISIKDGSVVLLYLQHRVPGLERDWISSSIRSAVMGFFDQDGVHRGDFNVMLAKAVGIDSGKRVAVTLHRTYLTADGKKAPFEKAKKQMPSHLKLNGAAILVNTAPPGPKVYVAEGIETAFAIVAMTGNQFPVYATLNAGNMALFQPQGHVKRVVICADHDAQNSKGQRVGILDANKLKDRLTSCGIESHVRYPKTEGMDWADVWLVKSKTAFDQGSGDACFAAPIRQAPQVLLSAA